MTKNQLVAALGLAAIILILAGALAVVGALYIEARDQAELWERNTEAALDSNRVLTEEVIPQLEGRRAAERQALQVRVDSMDRALKARERQLGAQTVAMSRVRLQRDSLSLLMVQVDTKKTPTGGITWAADTAGIHARLTIRPPPDPNAEIRFRIQFEPVDVLQAFMRDDAGRMHLMAIADSIHTPIILEPPVFEPPDPPGLFSWDINVGNIALVSVGCGAAAGMSKLLGNSWAEAGAVAGACGGAIVGLRVVF